MNLKQLIIGAHYANIVFVILLVTVLSLMYCSAMLSMSEYGMWPKYSEPESWSTYPLMDWRASYGYSLLFIMLGFPFVLVALIFNGFSLRAGLISEFSPLSRIAHLAILLLILLYLVDPFGVRNWFVD